MKKNLISLSMTALTLATIAATVITACTNPANPFLQKPAKPEKKNTEKVNAAIPLVTAHPQDAVYAYGDTVEALTVSVSVSDGGTLSYQWYRNEINSNEEGTEIDNATGASYMPPGNASTVYYYVVITNTIADNGDGGNKIASVHSNTAEVIVNNANPTVTWPTGLTALYGQTLANVSLPGNGSGSPAGTFTWTTQSNSVGDLGTRSHNMTFTPTDTTNYNTLTQNINIIVRLVEMVNITSGMFTMGSPSTETGSYDDERPQRQVTLSAFSLGKYEITQAQYQMVMGTNPSYSTTGADAGETQSRRPVEQVSWYDALVFCNKLSILEGLSPAYRISGSTDPAAWGTVPTNNNATWNAVVMVAGSNGYRLPTEAQWEYACRAGTTTPWHSGTETALANYAWISTNSGSKTHEVGKKAPNAWGLYDMHGNVREWCWDWFGTYPSATQTDPLGASSGSYRVVHGGSWYISAQGARSARRSNDTPSGRVDDLGFRVLRP